MPIISEKESASSLSHPNFFENLEQLDGYASKPKNRNQLESLARYKARSDSYASERGNHGKLLVCHDYKGGYTENPSTLAYTFNFWDQCETFIYFSHQRVSMPPPGWVNAAHRQGVKILGVIIFEHQESIEDTLRLLLGKLPSSRTGPPAALLGSGLPISRHYARLLADLAHERGFDGYLLNFEFPFIGQSQQARAIEAWISLLDVELKEKVGEHSQTIWYDSVITTGALRWQDRLDSRNLSFFLASDAFFTNYTWPPSFPSFSAQYLLGLDPNLLQGKRKALRDIYVGIDVWGRGSHGGGGLGSFRAAEHIDPSGLGLSVALFGPAWSWESDEGKEGWSWDTWWERDRTLWTGPAIEGAHVEVPDPPLREGEPPCPHGQFRPFQDFFERNPPPKPDFLPFFTSFCPGVGHAWFVEGRRVMYKKNGWTDVDKQTSLGNLLWPRPIVRWDGDALQDALPKASSNVLFEDAFNSGSSVSISLSGEGNSDDGGPTFRCLWIPIQSITLTTGELYEAELVYKVRASEGSEVDIALSFACETETETNVKPVFSGDIVNGWSKLSITCNPTARPSAATEPNDSPSQDTLASIGVVLAIASDDASLPYSITISVGQLSVSPRSSLADPAPYEMRLLWADCTRSLEAIPNSNSSLTTSEVLTITWDTCISYTSPATVGREDLEPEVPRPPWTLDRSAHWFPRLQYSNIYAERHSSVTNARPTGAALFLGTSGWGSGATTGAGPHCFVLERSALPMAVREGKVRFYVQGVTDRGAVLPWERCAFVDFEQ